MSTDDAKLDDSTISQHSHSAASMSAATNGAAHDEAAPAPRLCHLKKWPHFQGYGFNLHAERAKMGQHIGKVDADSPAHMAGLREGDLIVEVNHVNVSNENHQQVVKRIRNGVEYDDEQHPDEVILLVVDSIAEDYYRKLGVVVKSDFENVQKGVTPPADEVRGKSATPTSSSHGTPSSSSKAMTTTPDSTVDRNNNNNNKSTDSTMSSARSSTSKIATPNTDRHTTSIDESIQQNGHKNDTPTKADSSSASSIGTTPASQTTTPKHIDTPKSSSNTLASSHSSASNLEQKTNTLNSTSNRSMRENNDKPLVTNNNSNNRELDPYKMTAAEFKQYLKTKSRTDPKITTVNMADKFKIFQAM